MYADPSIYDILHTPGAAAEVTGLERMERRFLTDRGVRPGAWLEPACGTGRYLRVAARRGRRVVGFDQSDAMIDYARARIARLGLARRATLFTADMETFDASPPFKAIAPVASPGRPTEKPSSQRPSNPAKHRAEARCHCPRITFAFNLINTFRHLETDTAALAHLRALRRVLIREKHAAGVYALGISMTGYGTEFPSEDIWEARRGKVHVRQIAQYQPPTSRRRRYEQVHNILVIQRPNREDEIQTSSYRLRTWDRAQLEPLIVESGFTIEAHVDEDGHDVPVVEPGYTIWILRA